MRPQLTENLLKYGVLRCRELVELYFGWRMVTDLVENFPYFTATEQFVLMAQDPRRIRYEIVVENLDVIPQIMQIGSPRAFASSNAEQYSILPGDTKRIMRDFLTDLDGVTIEVDCIASALTLGITTRETFLTPAPVDELPLG